MIGPRRAFLGFILEKKAAVRTVLGSDTAIAGSLIRDMCHVQMHQSGRTWLVARHIYIHGSIPT